MLNELNKLVNYQDKMSLSIGGVYDKGFMGWSWLLFWCFDFVSFIAFQNIEEKNAAAQGQPKYLLHAHF